MRVIELPAFGAANLRFAQRPDPAPGPREVLVRVHATSINYRDLLMIAGQYNPKQALPLVPFSDGAGEVVAVGAGVQRVRVGDRVCGMFAQKWLSGPPVRENLRATLGGPLDGALQELWLLPEDGVARFAPHLSYAEAATLPCAGVTAWSALVEQGHVQAGDTVLVQGTGGVSMFALQLGVLCGARVIVTSSSDDKLQRAQGLGAWQTINYRATPQWGKAVLAKTDGRGVDHVIEVGGAGTMQQSLQCVRPGGHVAVIGVLAGGGGDINLLPILMGNLRVLGVLVGSRDAFEALNRAIATSGLRPVVDRTFAWTEIGAALDLARSGGHFGKVVVTLD